MTTGIQRVGIVAKHGLHQAAGQIVQLGTWLRERGVDVVYETETAALAGASHTSPPMTRDDLANAVDLVVVLGGDGTLLAMAARIGRAGRDAPILGVNFGSLGFLTEIRIDELYTSLEAVLNGDATYDLRTMLTTDATREGRQIDARLVLNDVVLTKGALSRMIELSVSVSGGFVT